MPTCWESRCPLSLGQTYEPLEILVVDNASHDDTEAVVSRFGVRSISLDHNYGFGPAINLGVAAARADVLVFVNNDMRFDPMFVERLVEPIRDEGVFATDACQFSWNGEDQLHGASHLIKRTARDLIRRPAPERRSWSNSPSSSRPSQGKEHLLPTRGLFATSLSGSDASHRAAHLLE